MLIGIPSAREYDNGKAPTVEQLEDALRKFEAESNVEENGSAEEIKKKQVQFAKEYIAARKGLWIERFIRTVYDDYILGLELQNDVMNSLTRRLRTLPSEINSKGHKVLSEDVESLKERLMSFQNGRKAQEASSHCTGTLMKLRRECDIDAMLYEILKPSGALRQENGAYVENQRCLCAKYCTIY